MSEADYMDDCQRIDQWDDEHKTRPTHEVVVGWGRVVFKGSAAACWLYRYNHGGFVRERLEGEEGLE